MPIKSFFLFIQDENNDKPEMWVKNETFRYLLDSHHLAIQRLFDNVKVKDDLTSRLILNKSLSIRGFYDFLNDITKDFNQNNIDARIYFSRKLGGDIYPAGYVED